MRYYIFVLSLVLCTNGWRIGFPFQWPPFWYTSWYEGRNHCIIVPSKQGKVSVSCHEHTNTTDLVSGNDTSNFDDGCKIINRTRRDIPKDKVFDILEKVLTRIWEKLKRTPVPPDMHVLYPMQTKIINRLSKIGVELDLAGQPKEILKDMNKNTKFFNTSARLQKLNEEIDDYLQKLKTEKVSLIKDDKMDSLFDKESLEIPAEDSSKSTNENNLKEHFIKKLQKKTVTSSNARLRSSDDDRDDKKRQSTEIHLKGNNEIGNTKEEKAKNENINQGGDTVEVSLTHYKPIDEKKNPKEHLRELRKRYMLDVKTNKSLPISERIINTDDYQLDLEYETGPGLPRKERLVDPFESPKQEMERLLRAKKIIEEIKAKKKPVLTPRVTSTKQPPKSVKEHVKPKDNPDYYYGENETDDDDDNFLVSNEGKSNNVKGSPWTLPVDPERRAERDRVADENFAYFARIKAKRAKMDEVEGVGTPPPEHNRTILYNLLNIKEVLEKGHGAIRRTVGSVEKKIPTLEYFIKKRILEEKKMGLNKSENANAVTEKEKTTVIPKRDRPLPEKYLISEERVDNILDDEKLQDEAVARFEKGLKKEDEKSEKELQEKGYVMPATPPDQYKK